MNILGKFTDTNGYKVPKADLPLKDNQELDDWFLFSFPSTKVDLSLCTLRIVLRWLPPTGFSGNVAFVATVVEKFTSYWVGIQVGQFPLLVKTNTQCGL